MKKYVLSVLLIFSFCAALSAREKAGFTIELPKKRYLKLNTFERAQYKKGMELVKQKQYRAASSEFEKFKIQYSDSPILSYVIFMRGYCLHQAKDRNKAIKVYNQVLDYFGEEIQDAGPALYYLGKAHFDNGNTKQGMEAMKEMVEDEDYSKHPLAAGALRTLADNHWRNKEEDLAVKYWKQVIRDFGKVNEAEAGRARNNLTGYFIRNRDYSGYESWIIPPDKSLDAETQRSIAYNCWANAWYGFGAEPWRRNTWEKYTKFNQKEKIADMKAFWTYYQGKKKWFEKTDKQWDYFYTSTRFLTILHKTNRDLDSLIGEAVAYVDKNKDVKARDKMFGELVNRLRDGKEFSRAKNLLAKISDRELAAWKEIEIAEAQYKFTDAIKLLDAFALNFSKKEMQAKERKAYLYKDRMGKYEEAIKLYREVSNPPRSLWNIQYCYYKLGKIREAVSTLNEIENSFPDEASKAAWSKAAYYNEAKDTKKAIAQAKRILKMYKKTRAYSLAHQLLEDYGIETGGGGLD